VRFNRLKTGGIEVGRGVCARSCHRA
jgi:hypothetical protein